MATVSVWAADLLYIDAQLTEDGALIFSGQDLSGVYGLGTEYEYAVTVLPRDVPTVKKALGGGVGSDLLELIVANADVIVRTGEQRWLRSIGVEPELWSHLTSDD